MKISSRAQLLWVGGAGVLGLAASAALSGMLQWSRTLFVLVYGALVLAFLGGYFRATGLDLMMQLRRRWVSGTVGGLLIGLLLAWSVSAQPGSARQQGAELAWALVWYGVAYGAIDALLLNVFPVLVIYGTRPPEELRRGVRRLWWGVIALTGSLVITALYHVGFPEFRGPALFQPLLGNTIITIGYLLTGNPLAALIAHIVMHAAAVIHGMETTVQLPPHY